MLFASFDDPRPTPTMEEGEEEEEEQEEEEEEKMENAQWSETAWEWTVVDPRSNESQYTNNFSALYL